MKTSSASDELTAFANQTTMHGIPKIILARSLLGRVVWSAICLVAGVMFVAQLIEILTRYFSYPKKVTVEVVPVSVPFPAVSLCNMRNLDFDVLNQINRLFIESDGDAISHINSTDNRFIGEYMRYVARYILLFNQSIDIQANYSKEFQEVFSRTTLSSNIPEEIISTAAIQLEQFVVNCFFGGNPCDLSSDFTRFFDPYYFNCYTYSLPRDDVRRHQALSEGIENGWSTILLTGSGMLNRNDGIRLLPGLHESQSPVSASDGVRVVVHPPDTKPFPLTEGYDIPPGYSVSLGLRPRKNIRVGRPHGVCTESRPLEETRSGYRMIDCMKKCLQGHVVRSCDCYDVSLPRLGRDYDVRPCRLDDVLPDSCMFDASQTCIDALLSLNERIQCAKKVREHVTRNATLTADCLCHPPCHEVIYDVSYSLSKWPTPGYEGDAAFMDIFFITNFSQRFEEAKRLETIDEYFAVKNRRQSIKDFARLNVYVADNNVIITQESPDYELNQLVSDIGGQLGLWIGISVITIAEMPELFWLLVRRFSPSAGRRSGGGSGGRRDGPTSGDKGTIKRTADDGRCQQRPALSAK